MEGTLVLLALLFLTGQVTAVSRRLINRKRRHTGDTKTKVRRFLYPGLWRKGHRWAEAEQIDGPHLMVPDRIGV